MKILHTADWHLGHRLHEQSQYEEQLMFLDWVLEYIIEAKIDILLISGDIFDTSTPSSQSLKMYYDFLVKLKNSNCKNVIITGGNHDSPSTLNASKEILKTLSIYIIGKATEDIKDEIFSFQVRNEKVIIAAVPYLRDKDIRKATLHEDIDEIGMRYKKALINHYSEAAIESKKIQHNNEPIIAMGHLFAIGGSTSDSEQSIYVGNLGDIGADDFPEEFDYIALGHLHRPQIIGKKEHIRYSGSPNALSFSEIRYDKKILVLEIENEKIKTIQDIVIPNFRPLFKITANLENYFEKLEIINNQKHLLTPWIELCLDEFSITKNTVSNEIDALKNIKVIKYSLKDDLTKKDLESLVTDSKDIKDLDPLSVFKMKCDELLFSLDENPKILDAFHQILQSANNS